MNESISFKRMSFLKDSLLNKESGKNFDDFSIRFLNSTNLSFISKY